MKKIVIHLSFLLTLAVLQAAENQIPMKGISCRADALPPLGALNGSWRTAGSSLADTQGVTVNAGVANLCRLVNIPVKKGQHYKLTCLAESFGRSDSATGFNAFRLMVAAVPSVWDDVETRKQKAVIFTADSTQVEVGFEVAGQKGAVKFSQFKLEPFQPEPTAAYELNLTAPAYRNCIFASQPIQSIRGAVTADSKVQRIIVSFNGQTKKTAAFEKEFSFEFPAAELADGNYPLTAEFLDAKGKLLKKIATIIRKLPPAKQEVIPYGTRYFAVNGHPFFPVLFWLWAPKELIPLGQAKNALYFAARHGVNSVIIYTQTATETLDQLNKLDAVGMKGFLYLGHSDGADTRSVRLFVQKLNTVVTPEVLAHPALLGYSLADEPSWGGVPLDTLLKSYECYKELDPYRPVWINAAPRGEIAEHRQYSLAADIYGVDIYPVPYPNDHSGLDDQGLTSVGKYAERMYQAVDRQKPVWMVLQGFSWGDYLFARSGKRYPTYPELRFMAYDSLMNHGSGVTWWGMHYAINREFWDSLFRVTEEMHVMSTLLVNGKVNDTFASADRKEIRTLVIDYQGHRYLIAANTGDQEVHAEINGGFGTLTEYPSGRPGVLSRRFQPFEVVVMGEGPLPEPLYPLPPVKPELERMPNPFHLYADHYAKLKPYSWKGGWIWEKSGVTVAGSKAYLSREFTVGTDLSQAELYLAADDRATIYLNGKRVGKTMGWASASVFDCGNFLMPGQNYLYIEAQDDGSPCGVLGELVIQYRDGRREWLPTDVSWRASATPGDRALVQKWPAAVLVAPYGGGVWGNGVTVMMPNTP